MRNNLTTNYDSTGRWKITISHYPITCSTSYYNLSSKWLKIHNLHSFLNLSYNEHSEIYIKKNIPTTQNSLEIRFSTVHVINTCWFPQLLLTVWFVVAQYMCLPDGYSKFELPFVDKTNMIGIGEIINIE